MAILRIGLPVRGAWRTMLTAPDDDGAPTMSAASQPKPRRPNQGREGNLGYVSTPATGTQRCARHAGAGPNVALGTLGLDPTLRSAPWATPHVALGAWLAAIASPHD